LYNNSIANVIAMFLKKLCAKAFPKSLWIYHVNTGSCNGCDIEIVDVITPYYDAERFGIKLAGSPRHADIMLVSGPVTRQALPSLKRAYAAIPDPKLVIVVGSCGCGGNLWFDTYNVLGGVDKAIPVNFYIPGCPPRPEAILYGVAVALGLAPKTVAGESHVEGPIREGAWR
jgi:Ni,Fe-hydrogenase III small subunit